MLLQAAVSEVSTGIKSLSVPAQVLIAILPLAAVILLAVLLFFTLLWEYRKKKLLIEKGKEHQAPLRYEKLFLLGIVAFFIGAGLVVFFALYSGVSSALLGGIIPAMAGLGIIIFYWARKT
jgi:hypothetical protein